MPGLQYTGLPVAPMQQQPTGMGGGAQEQQMMQIMQMLQARASDPAARMEMARRLAQQMPPPPDNIFGRGVGMRGGHQALAQPQQAQMPNFGGLGALMMPQGGAMTPPPGMMTPGGNGQAAITMAPTNGPAAFQWPTLPMGGR